MACAALPYCALAFAESERYLPSLIGKVEGALEDAGVFYACSLFILLVFVGCVIFGSLISQH